jgi:hypothetical protein
MYFKWVKNDKILKIKQLRDITTFLMSKMALGSGKSVYSLIQEP